MNRTRVDRSDRVRIVATEIQKPGTKPRGFWYSVDGDWELWCKSEQPGWIERSYIHSVTLGEEMRNP